MKIYAEIAIEGIKPILFHTFPIDTLSRSKSKSGTAGEDGIEWKKTVLMTADRELYIYNSYLCGAIVAGGKQIKIGKATLNKKIGGTLEVVESHLHFGLYVPEDDQLLRKEDEDVYLDVRSVVNPMTKGRNVRYRVAAKAGWKTQATISWDDTVLSAEDVKSCAENGGLFEGVGDGRRIGFGRFKVTHFKVKK